MEFDIEKVIDSHISERFSDYEIKLYGVCILVSDTLSDLKFRCEHYSKGSNVYHFYCLTPKGQIITEEGGWFNYAYPIYPIIVEYNTVYEMIEDYKKRFKSDNVKIKMGNSLYLITEYDLENNRVKFANNNSYYTLRELYERFSYIDDTKVGKIRDEF